MTALFYNSIIFFTLVVTVYEGRCWPINKYFDPVSCSADERAADGMEALLTRKGESVGSGNVNGCSGIIFFSWDNKDISINRIYGHNLRYMLTSLTNFIHVA